MKKIIFSILLIFFLSGCQPPKFGAGEITAQSIATKYNLATDIKAKYTLDEVTLTKTDIKNSELDKYKEEPKDEIQIKIGDNTPIIGKGIFGAGETKEFKPDIELKRWNEVSFKLKTEKLLSDATNKATSFEKEKIKYTTDKIDFEMYAPDDENYKYVWYLNEKPKSNIVEFEIESQGLDFFYQPPLTEEYQNGYSEEFKKEIIVTDTQVNDLDGNVLVERPENVVGSYAVYHSTKGGMNDVNGKEYKTGKAFHIYRPHIIDTKGNETWGNLHIENGIYTVEIPQEFLDKAVYPIKSNDTFGYTSIGVSNGDFNGSYIYGIQRSSGGAGSVTKISVALSENRTSNAQAKASLYNSSKAPVTNGQTVEITVDGTTKSWYDLTFSLNPTITNQNYYICAWGKGTKTTDTVSTAYDTGETGYYDNETYGVWPNPFATASWANHKFSLYATYTPSGGGTTATSSASAILNGNTILNGNIIFK